MTLRQQLMLASLLLLSLPWAGCQFVREMEGALLHGQEQALQSTARAVATVLRDKPDLLYPEPRRMQDAGDVKQQLYATAASAPIILDGYADGWKGPAHRRFGPVEFRAQTRDGRLYLLFIVNDNEIAWHDPREQNRLTGDRLVLRTADRRDYVLATAAPGPVQARYRDSGGLMQWEPRIRGYWQDSARGYTIELELPLSMTGYRLGFEYIDEATAGKNSSGAPTGNIDSTKAGTTPWLVYPPSPLEVLIAPFADSGIRLSVLDRHHWTISRAGELQEETPAYAPASPWLLRALYRAILNGTSLPEPPRAPMFGQQAGLEISRAMEGQSASGWYGQPSGSAGKSLIAAAPIHAGESVAGLVLVEQNNEQYLSLTDRAFNRLLAYSLLAIGISVVGLLAYASWLSWRIRRLSRAAAETLQPDGSMIVAFPHSAAADELGDLSRAYGELLGRLREYTEYLRTLSRKLSHELRTPIAVIRSSLDNLEQDPGDLQTYLNRAQQGTERLSSILSAMSEATHLEESIQSNDRVEFDLSALCQDLFQAYRGLHVSWDLRLNCPAEPCSLRGAPDLVAQMLDKLVDNAAGFTPEGGRIELTLSPCPDFFELGVSNQGPPLPEEMRGQLFDSMVSLRDRNEELHLGLGLHVVRLIAEFHGGTARGENLEDGSGVRFCVRLPR